MWDWRSNIRPIKTHCDITSGDVGDEGEEHDLEERGCGRLQDQGRRSKERSREGPRKWSDCRASLSIIEDCVGGSLLLFKFCFLKRSS